MTIGTQRIADLKARGYRAFVAGVEDRDEWFAPDDVRGLDATASRFPANR